MKIEHPSLTHIPALKALWQEAFGDSEAFIDTFFQTGFAPEHCLCVTEGTDLAAAAYWFDCIYDAGKAAYIYAVATAKAYRGRGCCRALMDAIGQCLAEQGYVCAILVPGDDSLAGMYAAMGYRFFGGMTQLQASAGEEALALTEVSVSQYALLRRQMLPQGSVVQEGKNLDFLRKHYRFYHGAEVLLVASVTEQSLFAPEFLGDPALLGNILTALQLPKGAFRMPGQEHFAMCRMLQSVSPPKYFAFAFD